MDWFKILFLILLATSCSGTPSPLENVIINFTEAIPSTGHDATSYTMEVYPDKIRQIITFTDYINIFKLIGIRKDGSINRSNDDSNDINKIFMNVESSLSRSSIQNDLDTETNSLSPKAKHDRRTPHVKPEELHDNHLPKVKNPELLNRSRRSLGVRNLIRGGWIGVAPPCGHQHQEVLPHHRVQTHIKYANQAPAVYGVPYGTLPRVPFKVHDTYGVPVPPKAKQQLPKVSSYYNLPKYFVPVVSSHPVINSYGIPIVEVHAHAAKTSSPCLSSGVTSCGQTAQQSQNSHNTQHVAPKPIEYNIGQHALIVTPPVKKPCTLYGTRSNCAENKDQQSQIGTVDFNSYQQQAAPGLLKSHALESSAKTLPKPVYSVPFAVTTSHSQNVSQANPIKKSPTSPPTYIKQELPIKTSPSVSIPCSADGDCEQTVKHQASTVAPTTHQGQGQNSLKPVEWSYSYYIGQNAQNVARPVTSPCTTYGTSKPQTATDCRENAKQQNVPTNTYHVQAAPEPNKSSYLFNVASVVTTPKPAHLVTFAPANSPVTVSNTPAAPNAVYQQNHFFHVSTNNPPVAETLVPVTENQQQSYSYSIPSKSAYLTNIAIPMIKSKTSGSSTSTHQYSLSIHQTSPHMSLPNTTRRYMFKQNGIISSMIPPTDPGYASEYNLVYVNPPIGGERPRSSLLENVDYNKLIASILDSRGHFQGNPPRQTTTVHPVLPITEANQPTRLPSFDSIGQRFGTKGAAFGSRDNHYVVKTSNYQQLPPRTSSELDVFNNNQPIQTKFFEVTTTRRPQTIPFRIEKPKSTAPVNLPLTKTSNFQQLPARTSSELDVFNNNQPIQTKFFEVTTTRRPQTIPFRIEKSKSTAPVNLPITLQETLAYNAQFVSQSQAQRKQTNTGNHAITISNPAVHEVENNERQHISETPLLLSTVQTIQATQPKVLQPTRSQPSRFIFNRNRSGPATGDNEYNKDSSYIIKLNEDSAVVDATQPDAPQSTRIPPSRFKLNRIHVSTTVKPATVLVWEKLPSVSTQSPDVETARPTRISSRFKMSRKHSTTFRTTTDAEVVKNEAIDKQENSTVTTTNQHVGFNRVINTTATDAVPVIPANIPPPLQETINYNALFTTKKNMSMPSPTKQFDFKMNAIKTSLEDHSKFMRRIKLNRSRPQKNLFNRKVLDVEDRNIVLATSNFEEVYVTTSRVEEVPETSTVAHRRRIVKRPIGNGSAVTAQATAPNFDEGAAQNISTSTTEKIVTIPTTSSQSPIIETSLDSLYTRRRGNRTYTTERSGSLLVPSTPNPIEEITVSLNKPESIPDADESSTISQASVAKPTKKVTKNLVANWLKTRRNQTTTKNIEIAGRSDIPIVQPVKLIRKRPIGFRTFSLSNRTSTAVNDKANVVNIRKNLLRRNDDQPTKVSIAVEKEDDVSTENYPKQFVTTSNRRMTEDLINNEKI